MQGRFPFMISMLGAFFLLLGGSMLLAFPIGLAKAEGEVPLIPTIIAACYGGISLATGVALLRRSVSAKRYFLLWCAALCLFVVFLPEMHDPILIPPLLTGAVLFPLIYRYLSRELGSAEDGEGAEPQP